jgi:molybdenum-dependent DNA-binding transcriptional regulator ModE
VATAEEASISAAARRLGTSAATVSPQLTNLEGAIGTTLLNRGGRPVTLTPAGAMFLRRANAILNEADQARAELAAADLSRLTRFRLGMIEDFDAEVTPRLLSAMAEEMKNCQFLRETGPSHRLFDALDVRAPCRKGWRGGCACCWRNGQCNRRWPSFPGWRGLCGCCDGSGQMPSLSRRAAQVMASVRSGVRRADPPGKEGTGSFAITSKRPAWPSTASAMMRPEMPARATPWPE